MFVVSWLIDCLWVNEGPVIRLSLFLREGDAARGSATCSGMLLVRGI